MAIKAAWRFVKGSIFVPVVHALNGIIGASDRGLKGSGLYTWIGLNALILTGLWFYGPNRWALGFATGAMMLHFFMVAMACCRFG
jgi:hypothetical protein